MEMKNEFGHFESVDVFQRDGYNEFFWSSGIVTREYPEEEQGKSKKRFGRNSLSRKQLTEMTPDELLDNQELLNNEMSTRGLGMLFGAAPIKQKPLSDRNSLSRKMISEMMPDELLDNQELIGTEIATRGLGMLFG